MDQLSARDNAILNCVFNPHLPLDESIAEKPELQDDEESTADIQQAKQLEIEAILLAEHGKFQNALDILNKAIQIAPQKASLYNNRGHIFQFQRKFEEAMEDVTRAADLAKGTKQLKTLCQAHVQKGILFQRKGDLENARRDFLIAAEMGDVFAKNQVVSLNPYAALCNQMLKQVMETFK